MVIDAAQASALPADKLRALLRKLRDLNLRSAPIAITPALSVTILGCASVDGPAECGVRYRIAFADGDIGSLELLCGSGGMELLFDGAGHAREGRRMIVALTRDARGRMCARALGARLFPETIDPRHLERFLRRAVRTMLR